MLTVIVDVSKTLKRNFLNQILFLKNVSKFLELSQSTMNRLTPRPSEIPETIEQKV